ncbi:hypothetical protein N2152v2_000700 [Parachlorella kessleri]
MVLFLLCIKADLEGVASVRLPPGSQYCITVKDSAGEDIREGVYVAADEVYELSGSRGVANFVMKWAKDSKREAYLNVEEVKAVTRALKGDDAGTFVPIIGFECRGLEPIDWRPEGGFVVEGTSGKVWEEVDLSEKEWADYDDRSNESVSIMDLQWELRRR